MCGITSNPVVDPMASPKVVLTAEDVRAARLARFTVVPQQNIIPQTNGEDTQGSEEGGQVCVGSGTGEAH